MQLEEGSIKEDAQQIKNKVRWKIENSIVSSEKVSGHFWLWI